MSARTVPSVTFLADVQPDIFLGVGLLISIPSFFVFNEFVNSFFLNFLVCFLLSTFSRAKWGIRVYDGSDNFAVGVAARRHTSWRTRTKLRPDSQSARKFETALSKLSYLTGLEAGSSGSGI